MMRLQLRPEVSPALNIGMPLAAVAFTMALCSTLIIIAGAPVVTAYGVMLTAAFGDTYAVTETLVRATPMIFTGLAVAVAFRAKFWNIGAEGQLLSGAVLSCMVGAISMPGALAMFLMFVAGSIGGALTALVPAVLRLKFKVDDVVSSLLLNSVILYGLMALIEGPWKDSLSGYPISPPIEDSANFPVFIEGTRLHLGVLAAFLAAPLVWFVIARTVFGFKIRATGENPEAARYGGIDTRRVIFTTALLSGGLAGLAGVCQVGGVHYQVMAEISPGYGYSGIVIAMLARLNPLGVVPAAIFLSAVMVGADAMSRATGVPAFIGQVVQGVALLSMLVALLLTQYRIQFRQATA
ncbi:ABC transporter permease [Aestuariivirga sp.]|uniref:ABC transporter permease n=1 Tax=Aestuariivirga sp. TaxID=2650926 RepID=UPI0035B3C7AE